MSDSANVAPTLVEQALPWGPVVHGLRWGSSPDLLLLLHEPGADLDAWGPLPAHLARRLSLEVTAYDLPGHGLSDDPWEPERLADLVRALAEREVGGRRFVVAAGSVAGGVLALAGELGLAGVILLSPPVADFPVPRSPHVPKLIFAGSLAGEDVQNARRLATSSGGWAVVTSVPVAVSGAGMLATDWASRIADQSCVFLHDCLARAGNAAGELQGRTIGTG